MGNSASKIEKKPQTRKPTKGSKNTNLIENKEISKFTPYLHVKTTPRHNTRLTDEDILFGKEQKKKADEKLYTEDFRCSDDCPGLERVWLERKPEDKHLGRLAATLTHEDIRQLYIRLQETEPALQWNIMNESSRGGFDIKIKALCDWTSSSRNSTFMQLQQSLENENMDIHKLCQVAREIRIDVDQERNKLHLKPSYSNIKQLSYHIGNKTLQLGIELGLSYVEMQEIERNHYTNLRRQTKQVLRTWIEFPEATYGVLENALYRIQLSSVVNYLKYDEELEEQLEIKIDEQVKDRIIQDIQTSQILDYMMTHLVISSDDRRSIEQHVRQDDQNKALLHTVIKRGEPTYTVFIDALRTSGYTDLANELKCDSQEEGASTVLERDEYEDPFEAFPWIGDPVEFEVILSKGTYDSFDNRVFLSGACNCGKSTLASVLIGDEIPLTWKSTDGLTVHFGRNGINLKTEEMVPIKDDSGKHTVFTRILRGKPNILQTTSECSISKYTNLIKQNDSISSEESQKKEPKLVQMTQKSSTDFFMLPSPLKEKNINHSADEIHPEDIVDKLDVSKLDHFTVRDDILEELRNGRYIIEIAPSDLVDFGGQLSYDMTHQLFIQHRGSFVIMFNGKYDLKAPLEEYRKHGQGEVTSESLIKHWINSILTYCPEGDDIMPMVLFAATHSDYFSPELAERRKTHFTKEVNSLFCDHEKRNHMFLEQVFFIDGTNIDDPEIKALTKQLVKFAMQQSTWGQKRPMAWVPLELQIDTMRSQNINIITKTQISYINRLNEDLALTERQLDDFLQNQHSLGKLMYYKQPGLDGFVILHTPALVNILRSFITDEMFWPDNDELKEILQNLVLTGRIYKRNLWKIWSQDKFNQYLPTDDLKAFVTKLLLFLDILIQPKGNRSAAVDDLFLVPCIVKACPPSGFFLHEANETNTIVLVYYLAIPCIPSALAFKLIAAASNIWVLKEKNGNPYLFHKAAVFLVDGDNEIRMCLDDNCVMVNLVNRKSLQLLSPDIASSIQECFTNILESSLAFYYNSFGKKMNEKDISKQMSIKVGATCKNSVCLLSLNDALQGIEWTCENGNTNHLKKYPMYWFFNKNQETCDGTCLGLDTTELKTIPSNRHLSRLACKLDSNLCRKYAIRLGIKTHEYEQIQQQYAGNTVPSINFMVLDQWKKNMEANFNRPTLEHLRDSLDEVDMNHHVLCQIFREDTSLNDKSDICLQRPIDEDDLNELPNHIGNRGTQLGIELELTVEDIEAAIYNNPKDMQSQTKYILNKWKTKGQTSTIFALMKALQHVKSRGLSYLTQKYIDR